MEPRRHSTASSFLHAAGAHLASRPAESALIYALASGASGPLDGTPWFLSVHDASGACVGAAMATPPRKALLSPTTPEAAAVVATALAHDWPECPGILLGTDLTQAFEVSWLASTGRGMTLGRRQRVHRLDTVVPPERRAAGRMREANEGDVPLLAEWMAAFALEALDEEGPRPTERALQMVERREWRVFETQSEGDWVTRTMAAGGRAVFGGQSVRWVYTPPQDRGHGFATTLVADLTEDLLARGASWCMLYTDLDNPTSNGIYGRIGYRGIQDLVDLMVVDA